MTAVEKDKTQDPESFQLSFYAMSFQEKKKFQLVRPIIDYAK